MIFRKNITAIYNFTFLRQLGCWPDLLHFRLAEILVSMPSSRHRAAVHRTAAFRSSNLARRKKENPSKWMGLIFKIYEICRSYGCWPDLLHFRFAEIIVSMPSSRHRAAFHRTAAFRSSNLVRRKKENPSKWMGFLFGAASQI